MIVVNRQASDQVKEPKVRNFYPRNLPRTGSLSTASVFSASSEHYSKSTATATAFKTIPAQRVVTSTSIFTPGRTVGSIFTGGVSGNWGGHQSSRDVRSDRDWHGGGGIQSVAQFFTGTEEAASQVTDPDEAQPHLQSSVMFNKREKLTDERRQRQEMEDNVKQLKNRVVALQLVEQRTVQRMVDTQKRTLEIITNKTHHLSDIQSKNEKRYTQEEQLFRRHLELKQLRDDKKQRVAIAKEMRAQSAKRQVKKIKNLKQSCETQSQLMQEEMLMRKTMSYSIVKTLEREAQEKRYKLLEAQRSHARESYTQRCNQELTKKQLNEAFLKQLESKELEMIKRLQYSQNLQQSALNELKKVVHTEARRPAKTSTSQSQSHLFYLSQ